MPKSGYDRYNELLQKEREHNFNNIVPSAISVMGVLCLLGGVLSVVSKFCTLVESLELIAGSFFLFGFSIIVKAACKYLDSEQARRDSSHFSVDVKDESDK